MRQYRGLTKDGKWIYGWHCKIEGTHYIIDNTVSHTWLEEDIYEVQGLIEVVPETIGQQTGLKDKNGKEIYGEGDIYKDAEGIISIVKMAVDGWALFPIKKETPVRNLYWRNICDKTKGEVIGNVHQNTELLEKE